MDTLGETEMSVGTTLMPVGATFTPTGFTLMSCGRHSTEPRQDRALRSRG